jgi:ribulose-phosphate 3-epimerase
MGKRAGVCINPGTPVAAIEESLSDADQVMVMTINPGWGGQQMIPAQLDKVTRIRRLLDAAGSPAELEIDGGVKVENVSQCVHAGASILVCGSSVFNDRKPIAENLAELRRAAGG